MIKIDDTGRWRGEIGEEIRRIERLLFDLNRIHGGQGYPPHGELAAAPTIRRPRLVSVAVPGLAGVGADGKALATGVVKVVAADGGWVRAADKLYRVENHQ